MNNQPLILTDTSKKLALKYWFVLYCKPNTEKKTAENLSKLGIEVYCPIKTEVRQWSDRKKKVKVPVLPSMILVYMSDQERSLVFEVATVRRFLYWLNQPAIVTHTEIDQLRDLLSGKPQHVDIEKISFSELLRTKGINCNEDDVVVKYVHKSYYCVYLRSLGVVIKIKK